MEGFVGTPVRWRKFPSHNELSPIGMDVADQDLPSFPGAAAAIARVSTHPLRYRELAGGVRPAIVRWYQERHGWSVDPNSIVVFPVGAKTAIQIVLSAAADEGSPIVLPVPLYSGLLKVAGALRPTPVVHVPLGSQEGRSVLDAEAIAEGLGVSFGGVVVLCNPTNPIGRVWTDTELADVDSAAASRSATIISDEVHSELVWGERRHRPFGISQRSARWVVVHSVSKAFNMGGIPWSWAVVSDPSLQKQIKFRLDQAGMYEGSIIGDASGVACLTLGASWLDKRRELLADRVLRFQSALGPDLLSPEVEAGYLVWCDFSGVTNASDAATWLWERAAMRGLDGKRFGAKPGFVRLNVALESHVFEEALLRVQLIAAP